METILVPGFQNKCSEIVAFCEKNDTMFNLRSGIDGHSGCLPQPSVFYSWKLDTLPEQFVTYIFDNGKWDNDIREFHHDIQIQRYLPGNYIVPHRDNYQIKKLHLVTLTEGPADSLVIGEPDGLIRIPDKAGQKIESNFTYWHWVNPVIDKRYSLVVTE